MTEKVKFELECSKEALELCRAVETLILSVKDAMKDGFQPGMDLPIIITSAITQLPAALQGIEKLPAEMKDTKEFANSVYCGLSSIVFSTLK